MSILPGPSSEFSFSFELEDSTVAAVPPSSAFSLSFVFEFEGGTAPSSAAVVRPSSGNTALLIYVLPDPYSEFSFFLNWKLLLLLQSLPPLYFRYCLHLNLKEEMLLLVLLYSVPPMAVPLS